MRTPEEQQTEHRNCSFLLYISFYYVLIFAGLYDL